MPRLIAYLLLSLLLFISGKAISQSNTSYFADSLRWNYHSYINAVTRSNQFVYIAGGSFDSTGATSGTASIVKIDTTGNTLWTYSLNKQVDKLENTNGSTIPTGLKDLIIDGDYLYAYSPTELWKIKESNGDLVWKIEFDQIKAVQNINSTYISYCYAGNGGFKYMLVNKETGKTTYTKQISTDYYRADIDGSVYLVKGDSLFKYSDIELSNLSWSKRVVTQGSLTGIELQPDGLYFFGSSINIFCGKLNKTDGVQQWFRASTYNSNILSDNFINSNKIDANFIYLTGLHQYFGSVYTAYRVWKVNKFTGQSEWEQVFNPNWNPNPNMGNGYVGANSLDLDNNGNIYISGYENANDGRTGVWGVCKFNANGGLVYNSKVFTGVPYNSTVSRGLYTFVLDNKVYHVGELQRSPSEALPWVYLLSTDTSDLFQPNHIKRTYSSYQYFSNVKGIKNVANSRYVVYKQLGNAVSIEFRSSLNDSVIWKSTIRKGAHFTADKIAITADAHVELTAFQHAQAPMLYDYHGFADSIHFIKMDTTGIVIRDKSYYIKHLSLFKSIQLLPTRDTNTVLVYSIRDSYNNPSSIHLFNPDKASGPFGAFSGYISSNYTNIEAKQTLFIPSFKDSVIHIQNYLSFNLQNRALYRSYKFKNINVPFFTQAGYATVGITNTQQQLIVHNLISCDSVTWLFVGKNYSAAHELMLYERPTNTTRWAITETSSTNIDMASVSDQHVFWTGRRRDSLVIKQLKLADGSENWVQILGPIGDNRFYMPLDQVYNSHEHKYVVSGYIRDTTAVKPTQSVFYIILDTSGSILEHWVEAGDFNLLNQLEVAHVTQFGRFIIAGSLYKHPHGRSGVIISKGQSLFADLLISSFTAPSNVNTGQEITLNFSLKNNGDGIAEQSKVNIYLSDDQQLTPGSNGDVLISQSNIQSLHSGDSTNNMLQVEIPCSLNSGNYYLFIETDPENEVYEIAEVNNISELAISVTSSGSPVVLTTGSTIFCEGDSVILSTTLEGIQWYRDGVAIAGTSQFSLTVTQSGSYTAVVTTSACPTASIPVIVTLNPIPPTPSITASGPVTFCNGSNVVLNASSDSGNQWFRNNIEITGANESSLTVSDAGLYSVQTKQNNCTSDMSGIISVDISPTPSMPIVSTSDTTTFCFGESVILTSSAPEGNQWYLNGFEITNASSTSFTATESGTYTVIATAYNCSSPVSPGIDVIVNPIPGAPTISQAGNLLLSSKVSGNQWYKNGIAIPGANGESYSPTSFGVYNATVTVNNCTSIISNSITFLPTAIADPEMEAGIVIGPNPVNGILFIRYSNNSTPIQITLTDMQGKEIIIASFTSFYGLQMNSLSAGTYTLRFENRRKGTAIQKLVVKQ